MPGSVEAGGVSDAVTTTMDLFPTVAGLIGASVPVDRVIDGKDVRPILEGHAADFEPHEAFFFYRGGQLHAVRSGRWKLHVPHLYLTPDSVGNDGQPGVYSRIEMPLTLFDLESDVGETTDVSLEHPQVVDRLSALIETARAEIGDYLTDSLGSMARPAAWVEDSWAQNPLARPEDRVSMNPAMPKQ
jgi:arylsulfatase A-like enzyme